MIHRLRVFADTRRQRRAGVRTTRDRTPPPRHRYSLVASATIASSRNLTILDRNCREFAHTNKPLILFHFGATVRLRFLSFSRFNSPRVEDFSRIIEQVNDSIFQHQVPSSRRRFAPISFKPAIVRYFDRRGQAYSSYFDSTRAYLHLYRYNFARRKFCRGSFTSTPRGTLENKGEEGKGNGTSKTNSTLLDTPRNRPPNFLPSILPSFLPLSLLPLSRPWNVVTRALRGENFCTHVFRVSHRCFIKPGPSGEGRACREHPRARTGIQ